MLSEDGRRSINPEIFDPILKELYDDIAGFSYISI